MPETAMPAGSLTALAASFDVSCTQLPVPPAPDAPPAPPGFLSSLHPAQSAAHPSAKTSVRILRLLMARGSPGPDRRRPSGRRRVAQPAS